MAQTVRDVMTRDPLTLPTSATVLQAAQAMHQRNVGDVLVEEGGRLHGILTDRDIVVRAVAAGVAPERTRIGECCSTEPETVGPDEDAATAVDRVRDRAVRRIPVVEDEAIVGIVSLGDLAIHRDRDSALGEISAAPPNT